MKSNDDRDMERWLLQARFAPPDPSLRARVLYAGTVRSRWPSALSMTSLAGVLIAVVAAGGMAAPSGRPTQPLPASVEASRAPSPPASVEEAQPLARPSSGRRDREDLFEEVLEEPLLLGAFPR
jgi:hypothetical protein